VKGADVLVHLAGKNRASQPELYESNVAATIGLLNAIERFGEGDVLFLYSSSLQVYKSTPSIAQLAEDAETESENPFSNSKLLAESAIRRWAEARSLRGVCLRIGNVYGAGCRPYYNSVVATFLDSAKSGKPLRVSGSGRQSRDFIYITDVIEAIARLAVSGSSGFEIYNLCTGRGTTILGLADLVRGFFPSATIEVDQRSGEPATHLVGNPSLLEARIGFRPAVSLEEGLEKMLEAL
jgi:nucleoside-diphosphate-sugar epimerase